MGIVASFRRDGLPGAKGLRVVWGRVDGKLSRKRRFLWAPYFRLSAGTTYTFPVA